MNVAGWLLQHYPALGFKLYRRYWLASLASVGAWTIANLTMGWKVFELSGKALDLGILGAASALPAVIITLVGGVIADRFDKRRVLMTTTIANSSLLFLLAILDFSGALTVWHVWILAGAISAVTGIDWPARSSFFPHLVERSALLSAVAMNSVLWQVTRMVLPAAGGLLLTFYSTSLVFFMAACGYLVMLTTLLLTPIVLPGDQSTSPVAQVLEGLRFVLADPLFRNLVLLSYLTMLLLSPYMQLMPAFASLLNTGAQGFGILMSVTGLGSISGTFLAGAYRHGNNYGRSILLAALVAALALALFSFAVMLPSYLTAAAFVFITAMGTSVFLILSTTALQARVPDELRGRVMGIHGITYSLMPLGALFTGTLAVWMPAPVALLGSIALYLLCLCTMTFRSKVLLELQARTI